MATFKGVNHLALVTGDMDETIRFWRDLLGARMVAGIGSPGYRHYFFEISGTDAIAFFEWPGVEPLRPKDHGAPAEGPVGFDHVSIGVENQADLWELMGKLRGAGFWVSEVVDHGFIHSIYTFDPNEIPIEFSWPVPGRDPREAPFLADSSPSETAKEGHAPQPGKWPPPEPVPTDDRKTYPGAGSELYHGKKKGPA